MATTNSSDWLGSLAELTTKNFAEVRQIPNKNGKEFSIHMYGLHYRDGTILTLRALRTDEGLKITDMGETVGWIYETTACDMNSHIDKTFSDICAAYDVEYEQGEIFCLPSQKNFSADYAASRVAAASLSAAIVGFCCVSYSFNRERKEDGYGEFSAWYTGEQIEAAVSSAKKK